MSVSNPQKSTPTGDSKDRLLKIINEYYQDIEKLLAALHSYTTQRVIEARIDELEHITGYSMLNHAVTTSKGGSFMKNINDRIEELEELRGK